MNDTTSPTPLLLSPLELAVLESTTDKSAPAPVVKISFAFRMPEENTAFSHCKTLTELCQTDQLKKPNMPQLVVC